MLWPRPDYNTPKRQGRGRGCQRRQWPALLSGGLRLPGASHSIAVAATMGRAAEARAHHSVNIDGGAGATTSPRPGVFFACAA